MRVRVLRGSLFSRRKRRSSRRRRTRFPRRPRKNTRKEAFFLRHAGCGLGMMVSSMAHRRSTSVRTGPVGGSCAGTGEPMPARPAVVTLKPRAALACVRVGVGRGVSRASTETRSYEQTGWAASGTNATVATAPGTARPTRTHLCQRCGRDLFQHAGGACAAKHESHRARVCSSVRGRGLD